MIRQYNGVARSMVDAHQLNLLQTARLAARDGQRRRRRCWDLTVMNAKYHYLFWRPVSAESTPRRSPQTATARCRATTTETQQPSSSRAGGRFSRHRITPNTRGGARGSLTGAMAAVFTAFLGSNQINLDVHGFDPTGPTGKPETRYNTSTRPTTSEPRDRQRPRLGGLHYRFSVVAGVALGLEGRRLRPRARLPTDWLDPASAAPGKRARRSACRICARWCGLSC